jgi:hypothetical protein
VTNVVLVVITDGRQPATILDAITSAEEHLKCDFSARFIVDDSGDEANAEWLERTFPQFQIVHHAERRGLAGAVRSAWTTALAAGADYVFQAEDDFIYNRKVKVEKLVQLLHCEPHLAQVSLKRQPVNEHEVACGGFIQTAPDSYYDVECPSGKFVEHTRLFSFNPCLIQRAAIEDALAAGGDWLEQGITDALKAHKWTFAIWGTKDDPPRVHHIGDHRSSGWSL